MDNVPFMPTPDEPFRDCRGDVFGIVAAARIVGVSRTELWRRATAGEIPCTRIGTKHRPQHLFRLEDLLQHKREQELAKKTLPRLRNGRVQCALRRATALLEAGLIGLHQFPRSRKL